MSLIVSIPSLKEGVLKEIINQHLDPNRIFLFKNKNQAGKSIDLSLNEMCHNIRLFTIRTPLIVKYKKGNNV